MNPGVKKCIRNDDFTVKLSFGNGEVRTFDVKPYLNIGVFKELKDLSQFKTARAFMGSVLWQGGQDLYPDTFYEDSSQWNEP
ncbi:MAG TPA: DUF2442 domain-containing protein [Chitinophagales bacterium]|nr:DUF2442 domain-containing protein [Chitinophagales bacterium]